jgi:hypothetical protein
MSRIWYGIIIFVVLLHFISMTPVCAQTSDSPPKAVTLQQSMQSPQGPSEIPPKENAPKIEFKETTFDFGKQINDQELKHSFKFKNTGKSMLVIEKVSAG